MIWIVLAPGPILQVLQRHTKKRQFLPGRTSSRWLRSGGDLRGLHFTCAGSPISTRINPTTWVRSGRPWARQVKSRLWFNPTYDSEGESYPRKRKKKKETLSCELTIFISPLCISAALLCHSLSLLYSSRRENDCSNGLTDLKKVIQKRRKIECWGWYFARPAGRLLPGREML